MLYLLLERQGHQAKGMVAYGGLLLERQECQAKGMVSPHTWLQLVEVSVAQGQLGMPRSVSRFWVAVKVASSSVLVWLLNLHTPVLV